MKVKNRDLELVTVNDNNVTALVPAEVSDYKSKSTTKIEIALKRIIDIFVSIFGIIALIPLTIGIYIANLICKDKGPIFYCQERIGKDGKIFKMYKYRSMVVGADEILEKYLAENEEARKEYKKFKKLKDDPRVTKVGQFIRKISFDECPQFINVFKGDMSLVGPRPYLEREKEDMNGYYKYIVSCKPGLTGLWQVSGRSDVTFANRIDMDMAYYYNHSLKSDLKILFKTAEQLVRREGAI